MSFFNLIAGPSKTVAGSGTVIQTTFVDVTVSGEISALTGTVVIPEPDITGSVVVADVTGTVSVKNETATGEVDEIEVSGKTC